MAVRWTAIFFEQEGNNSNPTQIPSALLDV